MVLPVTVRVWVLEFQVALAGCGQPGWSSRSVVNIRQSCQRGSCAKGGIPADAHRRDGGVTHLRRQGEIGEQRVAADTAAGSVVVRVPRQANQRCRGRGVSAKADVARSDIGVVGTAAGLQRPMAIGLQLQTQRGHGRLPQVVAALFIEESHGQVTHVGGVTHIGVEVGLHRVGVGAGTTGEPGCWQAGQVGGVIGVGHQVAIGGISPSTKLPPL